MDTLDEEEKSLLSKYLTFKSYDSLSEKFDELLMKSHENKKDNN